MMDLRTFMDRLEGEGPGELLHIRKPVRPEHDVTGLLMELESSDRYPTLFVHEVQGFSMPVITNLHATRHRLAMALGVDANDLVEEYRRRESSPAAPELVKDGPVKAVVRTGADVDLGEIPLLTHFDISTAPYVTAGIVVARDPVSGVRNLSFNRAMMVERNRLRMHLAPGMHLMRCARNAEERGEPLDIAFIVGVHPAFAIGALSLAPFDVDEYDVIGGMMERPVPLVRCETVPLEVPAHAEMVFEGRILPNVREEEGPFGEFTGHAVGVRRNHVSEITGVTLREKPLYQDIFTGHSEQRLMGSIPREAAIFRAVKAVAAGTRAVHMPPSGNCRFHCYISLDKRSDGEVRNAVMAAMATDLYLKLVIVVDGDVNVYNERDVMWAVANRVQADTDTFIIPRCQGSETDPSSGQGGTTAKMVIDATKKRKDFPKRLAVPDAVRERIRVEDYID